MRDWIVDTVLGGAIGAAVGTIVAVNFVIYFGIEGGYEASIAKVFRESRFAGVVTVALLVAGPVIGVVVARRSRRARSH